MENLFENLHNEKKPLAERMRPAVLEDVAGQEHILGKGKLLRRLIEAKMVPSVIFYGPPGTGKTTLARIIADTSNSDFVKLNAISSGVAEVKAVIEKAQSSLKCRASAPISFWTNVTGGQRRRAIPFCPPSKTAT